MSKQMTFLGLAEAVLEKAKYPLGYKEIWEQAKVMGLDKEKINGEWTFKTPPQVIMRNQMYDNIRQKKDNSKFYQVSSCPTTFWLKSRKNELGNETEIEQKRQEIYKVELDDYENKLDKKGFKEKELHSLLVGFVAENEKFGLRCKTIEAGASKKGEAGLGEWNHPDIVGIHFPFDDYKDIAFDLLHKINMVNYKIYSFEIKRVINPRNLKECYFQAVSNSSWTNYGYLVAWEIKLDDERAKMEAERLNESFGIGMIELKKWKVIFEAKERELDIRTFNMLVEINTNFSEFIKNIYNDIQTFLTTKELDRINTNNYYDTILIGNDLQSYKEKIRSMAE